MGSCRPQLVIPSSFQECLSYEQQIMYLNKKIEELNDKVIELESKIDPQYLEEE